MFSRIIELICKNKNIFLLITVGIYILALFSVLSSSYIILGLIFTLLLIIALVKNIFPVKYIFIWVFVFYFGIFNTSCRIKNTDLLYNISPCNAIVQGKIVSIPQSKNSEKTTFFFKPTLIESNKQEYHLQNEKLLVTLSSPDKLKIYDSYKLQGRLAKPFKAGNPSQFDYGNYLKNYDTYAVFYAKQFSKLSVSPTKIEVVLQWINDYRERIIQIHSAYLKSPNLEILGGIVFGDDAVSPSENIRQSFINSGLLHILAASGMNVAFIFSFFFLIFSTLKINYKLNISIGIITVILYSLMTGLGASVVRASLMLVFVLIGKLIDRDAHSISLLSFVAFLMLIYNPMYINDVGFQLSFIVTLGLLLMTPYIVKSKNNFVNWILGTIFIPVIAQLWVIPLQIFYFNNISLYAVFANVMCVPILSIISFGGFISSLLAGIPLLAHFICKIFDIVLNPLITILINISDFWGHLPNAAIQTTHPKVYQIILYYLILIIFTGIMNAEIRQKYGKRCCIILVSLISCLLITTINIPNHNLEITAFDVGNADSFLVKTPKNKYIFIDTGKSGYNGGKSQAEIIIIKYLKDNGIKNIDSLIITHFDSDHCGGAPDMLNSLNVKRIYVNSLNHDSTQAQEIFKIAKEKNVQVVLAKNNQDILKEQNLKITNFISADCHECGDNDASILTLIKYGEFQMLFMGDAGVLTFDKLKEYLPQNITVLKVGHHGAKNVINKSMVEYLNPQLSLISVGENKFGHPDIQTIKQLAQTKILRTDKHNAIKFSINNNGFKVFTYSPIKKQYKVLKIFLPHLNVTILP